MKFLDYIHLTTEKQFDHLHDVGEFVDSYYEWDVEYLLYSVDNYFVELTCSPDTGETQLISPIRYGKRLEKYCFDLRAKPKPWD